MGGCPPLRCFLLRLCRHKDTPVLPQSYRNELVYRALPNYRRSKTSTVCYRWRRFHLSVAHMTFIEIIFRFLFSIALLCLEGGKK